MSYAKAQKIFNINNIIDTSADVLLILFDVLSSPILMVVRLFRYIVNKFLKKYLVKGIKRIVKNFRRNNGKDK